MQADICPVEAEEGEALRSNDLLPCPFCGGKAKAWGPEDECYTGLFARVSCHCGISTGNYRTQKEAIEKWNTRAGDEAVRVDPMVSPPNCHKVVWSRPCNSFTLAAICEYCGTIFHHSNRNTDYQCNAGKPCPANKAG
jgi:Lar family restriction alleviation protein